MSNELKTKQIEEAKERLKILVDMGLMEDVAAAFDNDGTIYYSFYGILYWLKEHNNCDNLVEAVKRFERKHKALVYKAIFSKTEIGDMLSLLYISEHQHEWEYDRQDLQNGLPIVYVDNLSDRTCSEFGAIGIKTNMGGLIRTA